MAVPALTPHPDPPRSVPLREARTRFSQLVALAELTDEVTVVTRDGDHRPVAAIVPAVAARSGAQARADSDRLATVTAGWARRLDEQHRHFIAAYANAKLVASYSNAKLGQLWQVLTPLT
ncbi:type II toxin-antitoxin system Phd/YefM family antitoxin, partial [Micromonospora sp. CV4]|uniref:type II toxin-antitoxin system Phd/YefM family antitoxin n=1 Tax=Micromonospora sp. CV4 TaxID=2478711 RepID=UPI001F16DCF8